MVERHDVEMAYRLLMGREPESEQIVLEHMRSKATLQQLRASFMQSEEFRQRAVPGLPFPVRSLDWPPIRADTVIPDQRLHAMIARIESIFDYLGKIEPHWSVLAEERFKASNIAAIRKEFYESGKLVVRNFLHAAALRRAAGCAGGTCLELGCGVGRSTIWLADHFRTVIGTDISAPHLELARQAAAEFGRPNISLARVHRIGAIEALPSFDAFFSIIVLQHNPPPLIRHLLRTILGKLNPGGLAYFQVPTYIANYTFDAETYLASTIPFETAEMHVLPQAELFAIAAEAGCRMLEIREDEAAGRNAVSNRILLQKTG